jgi:hypothetical protein
MVMGPERPGTEIDCSAITDPFSRKRGCLTLESINIHNKRKKRKILVVGSDGGTCIKIDWPTERRP